MSGSLHAVGGNDPCHDEDGDPIYFNVDAYEPGVYDDYPGTVPAVDSVHLECDQAGAFEVELPEGRYDIALIAFQEVIGFGDFEDEAIVRGVEVVDGAFTSLGSFDLDVNDDD